MIHKLVIRKTALFLFAVTAVFATAGLFTSEANAQQCYRVTLMHGVDVGYVGTGGPSIQCRVLGTFYTTNPGSLSAPDNLCNPGKFVQNAPPEMCGITPAVNCSGSWGPWGACTGPGCGAGAGTQSRTYNVSVQASGGGTACSFSNGQPQSRSCDLAACTPTPSPPPPPPAPSCSGNWFNIGSCSNTCGSGGLQRQTYSVTSGGAACSQPDRFVGCSSFAGCSVPESDLTVSSLNKTSGDIIVGENINLESITRNSGSASTGNGFTNRFRYRVGYSSWNTFARPSLSALVVGASQPNTSSLIVPNNPGSSLTIQYCADTPLDEIDEENENNNCGVLYLGNITNPAPALNPPPATSTGLSATAGTCFSGSSNLNWNSADRATSYEVERNGTIIDTGITGTTYTDNTISSDTAYNYRVRARNSAGLSSFSSPQSITTPLNCIGPVSGANMDINVIPDQTLFRSGTDIDVRGEVSTTYNLDCDLSAFGQQESFNTAVISTSNVISDQIRNQNIFTFTCTTMPGDSFDDGSTSATINRTVDVTPTIQEI